ncbi:hypothetical protein F542_15080 [Bibersteinia trehalosi USDA-ARS-USMARC-188]|uniref:Uncharacterized protein n=1 Tax=Bibersteinia trehalosi USDA-ARS-USMARC-188 TaxID=1263829 RepID=A0A4V7IB39_BIBTR|nr:hypothetical protein F542_15080 [Bibersteinia trehalosi USDA-ARS-USMARC-188]
MNESVECFCFKNKLNLHIYAIKVIFYFEICLKEWFLTEIWSE